MVTRHILAFILLVISSVYAKGADWGRYWISSESNINNQIWFRRTYLIPERVKNAYVEICCNAKFELFINGRNASNDVLIPYNNYGKESVLEMRYDVGRFFQNNNDTATIAVWYSPDFRINNNRELSVELFGTLRNGKSFEFHSDSTWLWHDANAKVFADQRECIDGNDYMKEWNLNNCDISRWHFCTPVIESTPLMTAFYPLWNDYSFYVKKIHYPISITESNDTITYDFGAEYYGMIRLTMRGMNKGDSINADGLTYICRGVDDEQAFRRFTVSRARFVNVSGTNITAEKIVKSEYLEVGKHQTR
nr:alpha-L-rhamnosidase N-terminal domain-containing protein [Prevotella sp.]